MSSSGPANGDMSSRWSERDEDRMPEGMSLGGYDSTSRRYSYFDKDGSMYVTEPGAKVGKLTAVPTRHFTDQLQPYDMQLSSAAPTRRNTFAAPSGALDEEEHMRVLAAMAGGTTNASASAAPSWLANGAARSGEESDEEEREKRKKMNGFRRLSVQVARKMGRKKKEEKDEGPGAVDYRNYEEFTRPLAGPEVWKRPSV